MFISQRNPFHHRCNGQAGRLADMGFAAHAPDLSKPPRGADRQCGADPRLRQRRWRPGVGGGTSQDTEPTPRPRGASEAPQGETSSVCSPAAFSMATAMPTGGSATCSATLPPSAVSACSGQDRRISTPAARRLTQCGEQDPRHGVFCRMVFRVPLHS